MGNKYGDREYTYCFDSYARPLDGCRGDGGYDRYDRYDRYYDRYDRYDQRYRNYDVYDTKPGAYVGKGRYIENGRDAELTCEFPRGTHIISNIVWERVRDNDYRYSTLSDWLGTRRFVALDRTGLG